MSVVNSRSLAATLDNLNAAWFMGKSLTKAKRLEAASFIVATDGRAWSYAGMPAPTPRDCRDGVRLFTGERLTSHASICHMLGQEACRALILLDVRTPAVRAALDRANAGMAARLVQHTRMGYPSGMYCCGKCSCSMWRHLAAGGLDHAKSRLAAGVATLRRHRTGDGTWRRFPTWYTLLALSEIDTPAARKEIAYAAAALHRAASGKPAVNYARRRQLLARRLLG